MHVFNTMFLHILLNNMSWLEDILHFLRQQRLCKVEILRANFNLSISHANSKTNFKYFFITLNLVMINTFFQICGILLL